MSVTDFPLSVLRFQYQMARVPFQVMEEQFVARMDPQAPARLFYERWLGALDAAAGMVLGDPELKQRGAALAERSDALGCVAQLDATATRQRQQAADELKSKARSGETGPEPRARNETTESHGSAERGPRPQGHRSRGWRQASRRREAAGRRSGCQASQ